MPLASQKINPCLWFDTQAEEAARFYFLQMKKFDIAVLERAYAGDSHANA